MLESELSIRGVRTIHYIPAEARIVTCFSPDDNKPITAVTLSVLERPIGIKCIYLYRGTEEGAPQPYCSRIAGSDSPRDCILWQLTFRPQGD